MKPDNNHPGTLGNVLTLFSAGFSQLFFIVSIISLILTIDIYSGSGSWALITYIVFLPALVLFIISGAIASTKKQTFKAVYFYENLALMAATILGILFLALTLKENQDLFRPDSLNSESALMFFIFMVIPTGLGFALAWFLYRRAGLRPDSTSPVRKLSSFGLFILWILTNVFAIFAWILLAPLTNPGASQILFAASSLGVSMASGIVAGLLQFMILISVLRTANRWLLAAWIPITVLGSVLATLIYIIFPSSAGILGTVIVMGSQSVIGLLQWLLLRKHGRTAFLWIPVLPLEHLIASLSSSAYVLGDLVGGIISGAASSVISSVLIVYILRDYLDAASENTRSVPEIGSNTPDVTNE